MNLAWIVAVLRPRDVAPHPNFPDEAYDTQPAARLAALVMGTTHPVHPLKTPPADGPYDDLLALAQKVLHPDTIAESVGSLAKRLTGGHPADLAEAAAIALLTCSAAAELDDYQTCFDVLEAQLRWTTEVASPDEAVLRAALLQQKALRLRDSGQPYVSTAVEAATLLGPLTLDACRPFRVSPGISWSHQTTLEHLRANLLDAAMSFVSFDDIAHQATGIIPSWQERIRAPVAEVRLQVANSRAETYSEFVSQLFAERFSSQTRSIGGPAKPDLFYSVLALELLGHGRVSSGRRELAVLRLVQGVVVPSETADALRLLRHAAAKSDLDLALRRLETAGPLSALSQDARQILRTRTAPELLRTVELRVLRVAAELLAPPEARQALDAVRVSLDGGGPPNLPGEWELEVLRKEVAWTTAAALANTCDAVGEVAELLLAEAVAGPAEDQLFDNALTRALTKLDWEAVPADVQQRWLKHFRDRPYALRLTAQTVTLRMGQLPRPPTSSSKLDELAVRLNFAIRGGDFQPALTSEEMSVLREKLASIRQQAAQGSHAGGGINVADVAVGLIVHAGAGELWEGLTEFLLDSAVQHEDRSAAFDRLAAESLTLALPLGVAEDFRNGAQELLASPGPGLFGPQLVPFPAALRFLGSYRLLNDADAYDATATLAAGASGTPRREAAVTLAALAAVRPRSELLALALSLSRDDDVEVRAHAGRALAVLAQPEEPLEPVAQRRLADLLAEDGLLAPLLVLRALIGVPGGLQPVEVRNRVAGLAEQHPSRLIRKEATRLLAEQEPPTEG